MEAKPLHMLLARIMFNAGSVESNMAYHKLLKYIYPTYVIWHHEYKREMDKVVWESRMSADATPEEKANFLNPPLPSPEESLRAAIRDLPLYNLHTGEITWPEMFAINLEKLGRSRSGNMHNESLSRLFFSSPRKQRKLSPAAAAAAAAAAAPTSYDLDNGG